MQSLNVQPDEYSIVTGDDPAFFPKRCADVLIFSPSPFDKLFPNDFDSPSRFSTRAKKSVFLVPSTPSVSTTTTSITLPPLWRSVLRVSSENRETDSFDKILLENKTDCPQCKSFKSWEDRLFCIVILNQAFHGKPPSSFNTALRPSLVMVLPASSIKTKHGIPVTPYLSPSVSFRSSCRHDSVSQSEGMEDAYIKGNRQPGHFVEVLFELFDEKESQEKFRKEGKPGPRRCQS